MIANDFSSFRTEPACRRQVREVRNLSVICVAQALLPVLLEPKCLSMMP
jgi:hypothetical protein